MPSPLVSRPPTTKLKLSKFDFAPAYKTVEEALAAKLESRTLRTFRFLNKLPYSHGLEHWAFCPLRNYYCPYHH